MNPTFSILHASFGRPSKAIIALWTWFNQADSHKHMEYVLALNDDDPALPQYMNMLGWARPISVEIKIVTGQFNGSAPAWDAAAKASSGLVMIQAQDDVEPPHNWDRELGCRMLDSGALDAAFPIFIAVSDGYRKDKLCCTAIMTRARYEQCGEFLHPGYISVFSDDDVTIRAYADAAAGKCALIEARDLVFLHRHHYHDKSVPMDATYERENSSKAYTHGQALFMKRNADLVAKGFKTW